MSLSDGLSLLPMKRARCKGFNSLWYCNANPMDKSITISNKRVKWGIFNLYRVTCSCLYYPHNPVFMSVFCWSITSPTSVDQLRCYAIYADFFFPDLLRCAVLLILFLSSIWMLFWYLISSIEKIISRTLSFVGVFFWLLECWPFENA